MGTVVEVGERQVVAEHSYPPRRGLWLYRLTEPVTYRCSHCGQHCVSPLIATPEPVPAPVAQPVCLVCYTTIATPNGP